MSAYVHMHEHLIVLLYWYILVYLCGLLTQYCVTVLCAVGQQMEEAWISCCAREVPG